MSRFGGNMTSWVQARQRRSQAQRLARARQQPLPDGVSLVCADVMDWAQTYAGPPFHALLCDPPYHLQDITKARPESATYNGGTGNPFHRVQGRRGFMGKAWDGGDVAFDPATWEALAQHLLPGAFGLAFASSRGWHRLACAIEDAGLLMHPSIFLWIYGNGLPKATRVADAPDFAGHRYGLQALKPAAEPIILFQKPYQRDPVTDIADTGAGTLNIAATQLGYRPPRRLHRGATTGRGLGYGSTSHGQLVIDGDGGRWPANFAVVHDHLPDTPCQAPCPVATLGGRAAYFHAADWALEVEEALAGVSPVSYCQKARPDEREAGLEHFPRPADGRRNIHPTVKPLALTRWLATLLMPPEACAPRRLLNVFGGVGGETIGGLLAGWEAVVMVEGEADYLPLAEARLRYWRAREATA